MRRAFLFLMLAAAPLCAQMPGQPNQGAENQAAVKAMGPWLEEIDAGNYAQSWKDAGATFQHKTTQEHWVQLMKVVRAPFGGCHQRSRQNLFGQPIPPARNSLVKSGGYFVIAQFQSVFDGNRKGIETVCFEKQADGSYKAADYSIRAGG